MKKYQKLLKAFAFAAVIFIAGFSCVSILANGGPFVIKYPNGDPSAKGIMARLDPDLKPQREGRLKVIKEDLKISFDKEKLNSPDSPPLVNISAQYTIENPTDEQIDIDFGFPILRGVYVNPRSMIPIPSAQVKLDKQFLPCTIISNSAIYGIIRQRARELIEKAISGDNELNNLVLSVRDRTGEERESARKKLFLYLTNDKKWDRRDGALMVEYASLKFEKLTFGPLDRRMFWSTDPYFHQIMNDNLSALAAIGEQKATQFFAQLAGCFDSKAAAAYEDIFKAWGGDVRELAVDLDTGKVRPRELTITDVNSNALHTAGYYDPTIYARLDYFDENAKITEEEKTSCKAILKNLPVVFTFAPMNILHYQAKFPAKSIQVLTVSYSQYAYADTKNNKTYQISYVVHPASFWDTFGPINVEVTVPAYVDFRGSVDFDQDKTSANKDFDVYKAMLNSKNGELYLAIDADEWKNSLPKTDSVKQTVQLIQQVK